MRMTRCVISDSAVAAWAAPMLAISRSASSWTSSRERRSILTSEYAQRIEYERRAAVRQQRCTREIRQHAGDRIDAFDEDLLPAEQLIERERGPAPTDVRDHCSIFITV